MQWELALEFGLSACSHRMEQSWNDTNRMPK